MLNYNAIRKKIEGFKGTSEEALALTPDLFEAKDDVSKSFLDKTFQLDAEFNELMELIQKKVEEAVEREGEQGEDDEEEKEEEEVKPGNGRGRS